MENMNLSKHKEPIPITVVSLSVILSAVAVGVLIISPETFEKACEIIGVVL